MAGYILIGRKISFVIGEKILCNVLKKVSTVHADRVGSQQTLRYLELFFQDVSHWKLHITIAKAISNWCLNAFSFLLNELYFYEYCAMNIQSSLCRTDYAHILHLCM